jgi:AcrR family transcriptional regulator
VVDSSLIFEKFMALATRQRMSAESRRDQILDITRQVVDAEGFHAVSIERIAIECGITRTLIYQQFGSLSGMLVAMVDREFNHATAGFMLAIQRQPPSDKEQFTAALAGMIDAVDAAPATWRMFLMPPEGGPPELFERLARARKMTLGYIRMALEAIGLETTIIVSDDRELTIRMMYAVAEELVKLRLQDAESYTKARLLSQAEWLSRALFQRV